MDAADVRGQVEQLLARAGLFADPAVRSELAKDLTDRALARCVPLQPACEVPEHIRALTSQHVLDVETDLTARLAARATAPHTREVGLTVASDAALDAGQRAAAAALAGEARLVVVEGAAGAGKTTLLAATRVALAEHGRRLVLVTPTLKAAHAASSEVGARAGSAAWLAWQHGWRWSDTGWTRQAHIPAPDAMIRAGDLLLVDLCRHRDYAELRGGQLVARVLVSA